MASAQQQVQSVVSQREFANQMQVQNLLTAIQTLTAALVNTKMADGDSDKTSEAHIATENSLIILCERLDAIVADNKRWNTRTVDSLEAKLARVFDANTRLMDVRAALELEASTPHAKLKPTLMRYGTEGWIAIVGDPQFMDKALVGYGETPALALKCFDMIFNGEVPNDLINWLHEKKHTLDSTGIDGASETESGKDTA
jgi:hypothetical protein